MLYRIPNPAWVGLAVANTLGGTPSTQESRGFFSRHHTQYTETSGGCVLVPKARLGDMACYAIGTKMGLLARTFV